VHLVNHDGIDTCRVCSPRMPAIVGFPAVAPGATIWTVSLTCTKPRTCVVVAFPSKGARVQAPANQPVLSPMATIPISRGRDLAAVEVDSRRSSPRPVCFRPPLLDRGGPSGNRPVRVPQPVGGPSVFTPGTSSPAATCLSTCRPKCSETFWSSSIMP
jgi:hypothetical protein